MPRRRRPLLNMRSNLDTSLLLDEQPAKEPIVINSVFARTVHRGRLLRSIDRIKPIWHSQGKAVNILDLSDSHLLNILKKLQRGMVQWDGRDFEKGIRHPQYNNLVEEAARRGLCLNIRPNVSRMESVAAALMGRPSSGAVAQQSALSEAMRDRTAAQAAPVRASVVQAFMRAVQHRQR